MTTREQLIKALREKAHQLSGRLNETVPLINAAADMLEADGVPVAWMWEVLPGSKVSKLKGEKKGAYFEDPSSVGIDIESEQSVANYKWTLLYKAPQPAIQERKPMTDEQIDRARCCATLPDGHGLPQSSKDDYVTWNKKTHVRAFARAIEAAHGIGAKP